MFSVIGFKFDLNNDRVPGQYAMTFPNDSTRASNAGLKIKKIPLK